MVEAIITVWLIFVVWCAVGAVFQGGMMSFSDACSRQKMQPPPMIPLRTFLIGFTVVATIAIWAVHVGVPAMAIVAIMVIGCLAMLFRLLGRARPRAGE